MKADRTKPLFKKPKRKGYGIVIQLDMRKYLCSQEYNDLIRSRDRRAAWKAGRRFARLEARRERELLLRMIRVRMDYTPAIIEPRSLIRQSS